MENEYKCFYIREKNTKCISYKLYVLVLIFKSNELMLFAIILSQPVFQIESFFLSSLFHHSMDVIFVFSKNSKAFHIVINVNRLKFQLK